MSKLLAAYAGAAVVVVLLATGCAVRPGVPGVPADRATAAGTVSPAAAASGTSPAGAPSGTPTGTAEPATIVGTVFRNPYLTSTASGLYLRWALMSSELSQSPEGVARVDPANGEILAATGMMGGAVLLDVATLTRASSGFSATSVEGSNGIRANLWDGELWVTDLGGGPQRNYCADPDTGRRRATSPLPDLAVEEPMTVAGRREYYGVPSGDSFEIRWVPVPAACA